MIIRHKMNKILARVKKRGHEPSNKSDKNDDKKTDMGVDIGTDKKNQGDVPKKSNSSHKKDDWHGGKADTGDLATFDKKSKNQKSGTKKPTIIKDLDASKSKLLTSGFEIWRNGTVKCKSCNGKMDIPSAVNHTCQKRKKSTGVRP